MCPGSSEEVRGAAPCPSQEASALWLWRSLLWLYQSSVSGCCRVVVSLDIKKEGEKRTLCLGSSSICTRSEFRFSYSPCSGLALDSTGKLSPGQDAQLVSLQGSLASPRPSLPRFPQLRIKAAGWQSCYFRLICPRVSNLFASVLCFPLAVAVEGDAQPRSRARQQTVLGEPALSWRALQ